MPSGDWHARFPQGWEETARQFLLDEVYVCRSVAAVVSALLRGHPVIVGRDGHAICYVRPTYRRGALSVIYANSWGQWGVGVGPWEYGFRARLRAATRACKHVGCRRPHREFRA
ncbi:MAG: hypothetical protein KatS3mg038_2289 [Candidatus Kapaibacterium sp.]|nr:MAG: hypothetical protein KatS3mg038_2289 [Candidatus Kapabacteria bacterium]